ncbi:MAG: metallophosphoesterase family protein [Acidobacteriaceae bacterium]|nr:metallophosphoesterase family protein [Acidobacteriaceae bacterium]
MVPIEIQGPRLGVISDTHGLLRPEAVEALEGCEHIVHAGDVGTRAVIDNLSLIAPVTAIRGNIDTTGWTATLPETVTIRWHGKVLYVLHDLAALDLDPRAASINLVVSGHSHKPVMHDKCGVLYLNPGSAGPRRFRLPVTVAKLELNRSQIEVSIFDVLACEQIASTTMAR